ncbi:hypothetical protein F4808DRAFT_408370 [Astrocystis sublimbata]|nr:hypothetical protein F4808DRAFT_408370 [Astrocystis sublimbata]
MPFIIYILFSTWSVRSCRTPLPVGLSKPWSFEETLRTILNRVLFLLLATERDPEHSGVYLPDPARGGSSV